MTGVGNHDAGAVDARQRYGIAATGHGETENIQARSDVADRTGRKRARCLLHRLNLCASRTKVHGQVAWQRLGSRSRRTMHIGVLKEAVARERRVALVPDAVARLVKAGDTVTVERDAGAAAWFHRRRLHCRRRDAGRREGGGRGATSSARCSARPTPKSTLFPAGTVVIALAGREATAALETLAAHQRHPARAGARAAHDAGAGDGRAVVAGHRRRIQGGADRRVVAAALSSRC